MNNTLKNWNEFKVLICEHCQKNQYTLKFIGVCRECGQQIIKNKNCSCDYCLKELEK